MTRQDLAAYRVKRRLPVRGIYRGYEVLSMPPTTSGGVALIQMLNVLEGFDLKAAASDRPGRFISLPSRCAAPSRIAPSISAIPSSTRRCLSNAWISKQYAATVRSSINHERASQSSLTTFSWPTEGDETTHVSVVDEQRNAVSMTYTLEAGYGSKITVPGAGFLLNNEMGDFNAAPGLTNADGLIGTAPNLAQPGKRMPRA